MKSKKVWIQGSVALLLVVGLFVSFALAQGAGEKKACCGSSRVAKATADSGCAPCGGGAAKAACASSACSSSKSCGDKKACSASAASKSCPVSQFMASLSKLDLEEAQVEKMMAIWKDTEKKLLAVLTPAQMVQMNKPIPSQLPAKAACCGSCGGSCGGA